MARSRNPSNVSRETSIQLLALLIAIDIAIAMGAAGCWREPEHILDTPRPGAPAYWESSLSPAPRTLDGGVRNGDEDAAASDGNRSEDARALAPRPAPEEQIRMLPPLEDLALPRAGGGDAGDAGASD